MRTPEQIIREWLEDYGMDHAKADNISLDIADTLRADYEFVPITRTAIPSLEELMFAFHKNVTNLK